MHIIADRKTGEILSAPKLTPGKKQMAQEMIVKAYVEQHPDKLMDLREPEKNNEEPE